MKPQAGDIGSKIRYNAQESLADQTVLKLRYRKPGNVIGEWDAVVYSDTYAEYTSQAGDLITGTYEIQIYIETPSWTGHSEVKKFNVAPNLN